MNSNNEIDSISCLIEKCPNCNLTMQFLKLCRGDKIANSMIRIFAMFEDKLSVLDLSFSVIKE